MQLLYVVEVGKEPFLDAIKSLSADPGMSDEESRKYGIAVARKVLENQDALDALIAGASSNWDMERIAVVDKLIIRCAVAELRYFADVPLKVAINEAVDIAKKFSTGESSRFVNGVLDSIARQFSNTSSSSQRKLPDDQ